MTKKALGRGLKALFQDDEFAAVSKDEREESAPVGSIGSLPIEKIIANPFQPRKEFDETALEELKNSIQFLFTTDGGKAILDQLVNKEIAPYEAAKILSGNR